MWQYYIYLPQSFRFLGGYFLLFPLFGCTGAGRPQTLSASIWGRSVWWSKLKGEEVQEFIFQLVVFWNVQWLAYVCISDRVHSRKCWMGFGVWYSNRGHGNSTICFLVWDKIVLTKICNMHCNKLPGASPLTGITQVFVATNHKWNVSVPSQGENNIYVLQEEQLLKGEKSRELLPTNQFR